MFARPPIGELPPLPAYLCQDGLNNCIASKWPLSRFEIPAVVSGRALGLAQGAQPTIACPADHDVIDTATKELMCGTLPSTRVMRYLPDETAVTVYVADVHRVSKRLW